MNNETMNKHLLVQMSGVPGSGKSTIAREIGRRTNAIVIDNDIIRSTALDNGLERQLAGRVSYATMQALARSLLSQGFSVVLDSPCRFQTFLDTGMQIAQDMGACYRYIECVTEDLSEIERRLQNRKALRSQFTAIDNLPAIIGDMEQVMTGEERFRHWIENMARPTHAYLRLDTSRPLAECLTEVFRFLEACP